MGKGPVGKGRLGRASLRRGRLRPEPVGVGPVQRDGKSFPWRREGQSKGPGVPEEHQGDQGGAGSPESVAGAETERQRVLPGAPSSRDTHVEATG